MRKRIRGFCWVLAVFVCRTASADMIEVKDRGILNGKLVSQNEKEIQFKGADGKLQVFPRQDVLFVDVESGSKTPSSGSELLQMLKRKTLRAWEAVKRVFPWLKQKAGAATKGFTDFASQPLDRSRVDAKSATLAKVLDEASQASAAMSRKVMQMDGEVRKQKQYMDETWGTGEKDSKKGRFSSLN